MPTPFEAVYGATKAFLRSFGESLHNELKDTAIHVTVLMPGVTDTNFFHRAEMDDTKVGAGPKDDPAMVAKTGFDALMANQDKVVAGLKNKAMVGMNAVRSEQAGLNRIASSPSLDPQAGRQGASPPRGASRRRAASRISTGRPAWLRLWATPCPGESST